MAQILAPPDLVRGQQQVCQLRVVREVLDLLDPIEREIKLLQIVQRV